MLISEYNPSFSELVRDEKKKMQWSKRPVFIIKCKAS